MQVFKILFKQLRREIYKVQKQLRLRHLLAMVAVLFASLSWGTLTTAQGLPYRTELVGTSVQGRPITAYLFGTGANRIAFVGGLHQGDENNSTELINKAVDYYSQHVNAIPRDQTVVFIPDANPDGFVLKQRTNSRNVDLNRNWPTADWKADTTTAQGPIKGGGGKAPLSEPETTALWNYIKSKNIFSVIWYHSQGGLVVDTLPTANGRRYSTQLARLLAASTGYSYKDTWNSYEISGDASDFLNSKGIYSLTIELTSHTDIDWTPNLRGFSSAMSFFSTRLVPETGKNISGRLLAYWNSNGGLKTMGQPTSDQQTAAGRVWQQFQHGTLTLDVESGLVGWSPGATAPADPAAIAKAPLPAPIVPVNSGSAINGPSSNGVDSVDQKSASLREQVNKLQQQASDLQKDFGRINQRLSQPVVLPATGPVADIAPPPTDVAKAVKVVLGPNSTASVFVYEKGRVVRTMGAFSGKPGFDTPRGEFKIRYKSTSLQTNKWYEDDGTEYILKNFASFTSAALNYSDDWAFHQMRIPVSGAAAGQMQPGPSHGCLALTPADAAWFFNWAVEATPVSVY